jgi:DNA-binding SARP family transcriptional activator
MEQGGQWQEAGEYYQKGIESDDLAEEFYQRLMTCYLHVGKRTEAIRIYKRCKDRLSAVLGIAPSPKTEAIHQTLLSN